MNAFHTLFLLPLTSGCQLVQWLPHEKAAAKPVETAELDETSATDSGSPTAACFAEPLEAFPGQWEDPREPGTGMFSPFVPGAEILVYRGEAGEYFNSDFVVTNAQGMLAVTPQLADAVTGRALGSTPAAFLEVVHTDLSCTANPTGGLLGSLDNPSGDCGSPVYICDYDGMPVTLSWTITDLEDDRVAMGSIDLIAVVDRYDQHMCE